VSEQATARALGTSGQWLASSPNVHSWFENGDGVEAVRKGKRKKADRVSAIVQDVIESNRAFWAEVIAWSAFAMRGDGYDTKWVEMALVAREFAGDRPLVDGRRATSGVHRDAERSCRFGTELNPSNAARKR
jgi:hypothetical protein